MQSLKLRREFVDKHLRATAIELCNRQNTGWAQRGSPDELLEITYPTADVLRALESVATAGKPIVLLGQRGSGKSHIMALLHAAFVAPDAVESWASGWCGRLESSEKLDGLKLQRGFTPISETLSNHEYPCLWDVIFDRHPKGAYFRGKFEAAGTTVPAKSLLQDLFNTQRTALILDELQTWFDGLHDEAGEHGRKRRQWAFNFIQILSELSKERPDLLCLIASVRDSTTEAYRQIHRDGPVLVDFKGETAREDRKRLVLHRLFQNRSHVTDVEIQQIVAAYALERTRLLFADKNDRDQSDLRKEVAACWPFAPELLNLLEDHILMAAAAQDNRDLIGILAEVFRSRGDQVPVITAADFCVDDDECGVTSLLDSFATSADQERLREKAIRNLQAIRAAGIQVPHAREVISSLWMRSLSAAQDLGGTRNEVQLDVTRDTAVDDNSFTAELATIVENSFNIHEVGTHDKRFCFKLPENPEAKLKAWARNDRSFEPEGTTAEGLLPVGRDQVYLRTVLNYLLRSPDAASEQPSIPIVLDPNWERAPWANVPQPDVPTAWSERGKPVLIVIPASPKDLSQTLGPWLVEHVPVNRNMIRFLLPKADQPALYDDRDLLITARCVLLADSWKENDSQYVKLYKKYRDELLRQLKSRFDRYAILAVWDFETPANCTFHDEKHGSSGAEILGAVEHHVREHFFALEDFEKQVVEAAGRGETMKQLLALLTAEPLPGEQALPYLGELPTYEQVLEIVSRDKIAINVEGRWYCKEPGESDKATLQRLRSRAMCIGQKMHKVQLGEPTQAGSGGVAVTPPPTTPPAPAGGSPGATRTIDFPTPPSGSEEAGNVGTLLEPPVSNTAASSDASQPAAPVIRRSLGAKTGINLLGDLEKWALPDSQRVPQASLTISGASIKELRELMTRMPPKMVAELQITLPPEQEGSS